VVEEIPYVICKEYVKFCCDDIGDQQVALVVKDESGNVSHTWSNVNVEDKSSNGWVCRADEVECTEVVLFEPAAPTYGGIICDIYAVREIAREADVTCGEGIIFITWGAYDSTDELVSTTICEYEVKGEKSFNPLTIKWPKHYDDTEFQGLRRECEVLYDQYNDPILYAGEAIYYINEYIDQVKMGDVFECTEDGSTGEPVWCETDCSLIGKSYKDEELVADDACKKIIRHWTVIDWCTWDPNNNDYVPDDANDISDRFVAVDDKWLGSGEWNNHQIFELSNTSVGSVEYKACVQCEKSSGNSDDVYFRYAEVDEDGYYTYDQIIKIIDNDAPIITVLQEVEVPIYDGASSKAEGYENCQGSVTVEATVSDICGLNTLDVSNAFWDVKEFQLIDGIKTLVKSYILQGEKVTSPLISGRQGELKIIGWQVTDGCGNGVYAETEISFKDAKKPTPICIQELSTAVMSNGFVDIWAVDFDKGSFDNCGPVTLKFLLDTEGNFTNNINVGSFSNGVRISCDDIVESATLDIALFAVDETGNYDNCVARIRVDDNNNDCNLNRNTGATAITGELRTNAGDRIEDARVYITHEESMMTKVDGNYAFNNLVEGANYHITPIKDGDDLNGVSTLDLILIQQHILGVSTLTDPYLMIGGDVNNDEKISALDLIELRKLILGVYDELPNNQSWRFVSMRDPMDTANPWPFVESVLITAYDNKPYHNDFIGVKIGDVSGNAIANSTIASKGRSERITNLQIADREVKKGENIQVAIRLDPKSEISGIQFTLELNKVRFRDLIESGKGFSNENLAEIDDQTLTASWHKADGVFGFNEPLLQLSFESLEDGKLSEMLKLSSRVTEALAYDSRFEKLALGIEFIEQELNHTPIFLVSQNEPNPFTDKTTIDFELPNRSLVELKIYTLNGVLLKKIVGEYPSGKNKMIISSSDIAIGGVLYYQLKAGEYTDTKKMIILK
jgi:hypothetical protein